MGGTARPSVIPSSKIESPSSSMEATEFPPFQEEMVSTVLQLSQEEIQTFLERARSYSDLMPLLDENLDGDHMKLFVSSLLDIYKKCQEKPPESLISGIGNKILCYPDRFAPYELVRFAKIFTQFQGRDSDIARKIHMHLNPQYRYLAHLDPRKRSTLTLHRVDDHHMDSLLKYKGSPCPMCREQVSENPPYSLVEASSDCLREIALRNLPHEMKGPNQVSLHSLHVSSVDFYKRKILECIRTHQEKPLQKIISQFLDKGGWITADLFEEARKNDCSYQIMQALIEGAGKATLMDFRFAFQSGYPLEMISFMISKLPCTRRETLDELVKVALESKCSLEILQLIVEKGGGITLQNLQAALKHSSEPVLEYAVSLYNKGKLSPSQDLPYLGMETLPREKWDFVFSRLENPFEDFAMDRIINHFLSLSISGRPIYPDLVQYFLDKGGYIPLRTVEPILMAALPPELKIQLMKRWVAEGGEVQAEQIAFAMTPKSSQKECINTWPVIEYLFSQWNVDQKKIALLLKAASSSTDFVDFILILMDLSESLRFQEEFLKHKQAEKIVEYFLDKSGNVPSALVPCILASKLSPALKFKVIHHWLNQGGEVSYEILKTAFFHASYHKILDVVDLIFPLRNIDQQKVLPLIKEAALGGAPEHVIRSLIDVYEDRDFVVELLHHPSSLELVQYLCGKGIEVSEQVIISILKYPGRVYAGGFLPRECEPWLLRGKEAKLWLISEWARGEKIVSEDMMKLAKDCRNPPEVLALLDSLKKQEVTVMNREVPILGPAAVRATRLLADNSQKMGSAFSQGKLKKK